MDEFGHMPIDWSIDELYAYADWSNIDEMHCRQSAKVTATWKYNYVLHAEPFWKCMHENPIIGNCSCNPNFVPVQRFMIGTSCITANSICRQLNNTKSSLLNDTQPGPGVPGGNLLTSHCPVGICCVFCATAQTCTSCHTKFCQPLGKNKVKITWTIRGL